ncbi:MAG TPA: hypothetical protein VE441_14005, partial [Mycobacterium sp.]|nr:hypothetical protein [Mycobacterium sp.]
MSVRHFTPGHRRTRVAARTGAQPLQHALAPRAAAPGQPRLQVSGRARRAIRRVCDEHGPHVLLLSWPAGATCLPAANYTPAPCDVIIGHIVGCPIHADLRQLGAHRDRHSLLDTPRWARWVLRSQPVLRLHTAWTGAET